MYVSIRTDSSIEIGTGHTMRCLTLAEALQKMGAEVSFICRDGPGNINSFIEKRGFIVYRLPPIQMERSQEEWNVQDAVESLTIIKKHAPIDWLIVDHYTLDWRWEQSMRGYAKKIMVVDDLADRRHDCDLLLDQNLHHQMDTRYQTRLMRDCRLLLGPKYAMLRPQFYFQRQKMKKPNGEVRRIHICFGGSDPTNQTLRALEAIASLDDKRWSIDVVVGRANPFSDEVKKACSRIPGASFFGHVDDMATLLADSDLAIGGGGSSTWERCCLGVPSLIISIANNQTAASQECHRRQLIRYLGAYDQVTTQQINKELIRMATDKKELLSLRARGMEMVDGLGVTRVCLLLLGESLQSKTDVEVEQQFFRIYDISKNKCGKEGIG
ncbi:UDP-2,4-diacetamido-2,4,6-trideoxy-beta-L-altropyranose hydrolase [Desmospora activa]|uniref:UDP-2,4-diacetamido-2,4, 6-trideoxy-beta-L-altropyranose hydrolase n=1 Tax=Desmospora activa DSM 45169 TaxID=1121389 RepID=A0A2T4ZAF9_9BACL|nr:UDP-2,4-diacetamido-2,4,6-trideoxy-beta-L-altropyranose hydrolase [Desmospora activa]PTM58856.1 UDP-2,4-diacetamido-2,4,6-trideoxy-beta-L-altropyranose hydrolase [Desmospora activa DSM 45169]